MSRWIVELEHGVWLADRDGDPGRTLVRESALQFTSRQSARQALGTAREYRPFARAVVQKTTTPPEGS